MRHIGALALATVFSPACAEEDYVTDFIACADSYRYSKNALKDADRHPAWIPVADVYPEDLLVNGTHEALVVWDSEWDDFVGTTSEWLLDGGPDWNSLPPPTDDGAALVMAKTLAGVCHARVDGAEWLFLPENQGGDNNREKMGLLVHIDLKHPLCDSTCDLEDASTALVVAYVDEIPTEMRYWGTCSIITEHRCSPDSIFAADWQDPPQ